jgi:hypothetical protein
VGYNLGRGARLGACLVAYALAGPTAALATPAPVSTTTSPIAVGDPRVSGARLKPYDNAWLWKVQFPGGKVKVQGIWSDHLDLTTENGKQVFRRVQGMSYVTGKNTIGVNLFDPASCAPLHLQARGHRPRHNLPHV